MDPDPWLSHLVHHLPVARDGQDPEGVHQLRVACRRLDAWLRLGRRRVLRADLGWLRRAAGEVRDLDVLLERSEMAPVADFLAERRAQARIGLLAALDHPRCQALVQALGLLPGPDRDTAAEVLQSFAERTRRAGRKAERPAEPAEQIERLHSLRRALRQWRYALEWCEGHTKPLRALQQELGALGDAALARTWLARHPDPAAVRGLIEAADGALETGRANGLAAWQRRAADLETLEPWTSS